MNSALFFSFSKRNTLSAYSETNSGLPGATFPLKSDTGSVCMNGDHYLDGSGF
jgi:hypothetical protein